jgi:MFS superfamily sulfate permease-like transporter
MISMSPPSSTDRSKQLIRGNATNFIHYFREDFLSGFLVFLIALPLCLGISLASGFPPMAGIFTAIVGSVVATFISNSEMTIKGPAAGLIVIVVGCVEAFGGQSTFDGSLAANLDAYRATLAVIFAAAVFQIAFGLFRGGILGDFFPTAVVHGMLAAIGVIIILKQLPVALGESNKGEPLELLQHIPHYIVNANPAIASIGFVSLLIMFCWPMLGKRVTWLKRVPSQLIVLAVAIPMGYFFDLLHQHSYTLGGARYALGEQFLVRMPDKMFGMLQEITTPDFQVLTQPKAWWWCFLFFAIGSLESMLSAKAVDALDPLKRRTNLNRDLVAVGAANLVASSIGGLPMISEIVRSRANIDNGAKTRFANFWHGMLLLVCVAIIPTILHRIPLAALAAMLVYTGYRLAHPREFMNVYRIGREQLLIFVTTVIGVLATDLLIGVGIGIAVKFVIHSINGVPLRSFFKPFLEIEQTGSDSCLIRARQSAVFSNWIPFRRQIEDLGLVQRQNITVDLSDTMLVDSSVMEKLHEMQETFRDEGLELNIIGLEGHASKAEHELATRIGGLARFRRLAILSEATHQSEIERICREFPLQSLFTQISQAGEDESSGESRSESPPRTVRVEVIASSRVCDDLIIQLRQQLPPTATLAILSDMVHLLRRLPTAGP